MELVVARYLADGTAYRALHDGEVQSITMSYRSTASW